MTPRDKRERLFRHSRPHIRVLEYYDGSEYHKDIKIVWVAYKKAGIPGVPEGLNEIEFVNFIMSFNTDFLIVEDNNKQYKNGGPIAIVTILGNNWKLEPHVDFFPWATKKNILRGCVAFFQWARNTRRIGCVVVHALENSKNLFDHVCSYGVLHYVGKIVNGDSRGDEFIYSVKGKKR